MRPTRISPSAFSKVASLLVVCYALLVVTGGAVRLTGSGLGCLDWPTCSQGHLIASSSFHSRVEFSNRLVTVAVSVVSIVIFLAAWWRSPRRRDLMVLSGIVLAGLAGQVVLGGLVVLFKLNPWLVALHFVLTLGVLAVAIVLRHRNLHGPSTGRPLVGNDLLWLTRLQFAALSVTVLAGTVVTGSGPHAGGVGAKRFPVAFRDAAELHSTLALFLIGVSLATLFALHHARAPGAVQRRARIFMELLALQGVLGYTQYALHDSPWVVELHMTGATLLWCVAVAHYLGCFEQGAPEPIAAHAPRLALAGEPATAASSS
ncbi:MAG: cytochrome oxidase assembly [Acidimicrobiaceae bacterium]|nr:cytochrome oxidase assembly [Acidimicrobiaceae bacterium]